MNKRNKCKKTVTTSKQRKITNRKKMSKRYKLKGYGADPDRDRLIREIVHITPNSPGYGWPTSDDGYITLVIRDLCGKYANIEQFLSEISKIIDLQNDVERYAHHNGLMTEGKKQVFDILFKNMDSLKLFIRNFMMSHRNGGKHVIPDKLKMTIDQDEI